MSSFPLLAPNPARVVLRDLAPSSPNLVCDIVCDVLSLHAAQREETLHSVLDAFEHRHPNFRAVAFRRGKAVLSDVSSWLARDSQHVAPNRDRLSRLLASELPRKDVLLVGAYFVHEYAVQAAGLCNPSIVTVENGGEDEMTCRLSTDTNCPRTVSADCVISLRAIGEGHLSSLAFAYAVVTVTEEDGTVDVIVGRGEASRRPHCITPSLFRTATSEDIYVSELLELRDALGGEVEAGERDGGIGVCLHDLQERRMLASFSGASASLPLDSRVIMPFQSVHCRGIEDARFTAMRHDGAQQYIATATAYNGHECRLQLIETSDFSEFSFTSVTGHVCNKGFALFPVKVGGLYWMVCRNDDRDVMIMSSPSKHHWARPPRTLLQPCEPWELFKMGNCGSPLRVSAGWLLLTHGVGATRRYGIGVAVLDADDPSKVLGRLKVPLISLQLQNDDERDGYVPNIHYSCGGVIIGEHWLILPFAECDQRIKVAHFFVPQLLRDMGL